MEGIRERLRSNGRKEGLRQRKEGIKGGDGRKEGRKAGRRKNTHWHIIFCSLLSFPLISSSILLFNISITFPETV